MIDNSTAFSGNDKPRVGRHLRCGDTPMQKIDPHTHTPPHTPRMAGKRPTGLGLRERADEKAKAITASDLAANVTITFRALPSSIPASIRVRRLLKIALRMLDLRCVEARPIAPESEANK